MKIKIISPVIHQGKETGLFNYQYIDSNGDAISAVFQATKQVIEQKASNV